MAAKILVVEDHPANTALMELLLTTFGYRFVAAADGLAGLEAAERERPDLLVCDVYLPGLDGYGVVAALKRHPLLKATPVIAVSALAMVGDCEKLLAAGFAGYISKPIDPQTFVGEIERHLPAALRAPPREAAASAPSDAADAAPQGPCILLVDEHTPGNE